MKIVIRPCTKCGEGIYSRAPYDYISCSCGAISVDGGELDLDSGIFGATRSIGKPENFGKWYIMDIDVTALELYDDWNKGENKYGRVKKQSANIIDYESEDFGGDFEDVTQ